MHACSGEAAARDVVPVLAGGAACAANKSSHNTSTMAIDGYDGCALQHYAGHAGHHHTQV